MADKRKRTALQKHMSEIGKKAGESTLRKYGKEHYKKMARKRWENERD